MLFAQQGYRVAIAARRPQQLEAVQAKLQQVVPKLESGAESEVMAIAADISLAADVDRMVAAVIEKWGQIDVLLHSAGVLYQGTILETDEDEWDRIININLKGTYLVNRRVLQEMLPVGQGSIVNIASDAGLVGCPKLAAYCASKGGVVQLTRSLALDHVRQGVRVNALCPGPVATPMAGDLSPEEMAYWSQNLPIQRFATAAEVAEAAYYLAHAKYAVGSCLTLDGGNTAGGAV